MVFHIVDLEVYFPEYFEVSANPFDHFPRPILNPIYAYFTILVLNFSNVLNLTFDCN